MKGIFIFNQIKELERYGVKTDVISPAPYIPPFIRKVKWKKHIKPDVEFYRDIFIRRPKYFALPIRTFFPLTLKSLSNAIMKCKVEKNTKLIHAHFGLDGLSALLLKRKLLLPLITSFYGWDISKVTFSNPHIYNRLFDEGDVFLALSKNMSKKLEKLGCPKHKVQVLHLGIDCNKFKYREHKKPNTIVFLTVANFEEKKGIQYAIKAFSMVRERYKNVEYRIVGDGTLRRHLVDLVNDLKLNSSVKFINNYAYPNPRKIVMDELNSCDIFLLPSVTAKDGDQEGTPVVLMEAQACGIPCISTLHAGIPEVVIDHVTGFLVPERSIDLLVEKTVSLIEDYELRRDMGKNARQHIETEFNQKIQSKKLFELYKTIIGS